MLKLPHKIKGLFNKIKNDINYILYIYIINIYILLINIVLS